MMLAPEGLLLSDVLIVAALAMSFLALLIALLRGRGRQGERGRRGPRGDTGDRGHVGRRGPRGRDAAAKDEPEEEEPPQSLPFKG